MNGPRPVVQPEREWTTHDRRNETVTIGNLYLAADPPEPGADPDEDLGEGYTARLFDPDDEPEEIAAGVVGAFPFEMTYEQANDLRIKLNRLFC